MRVSAPAILAVVLASSTAGASDASDDPGWAQQDPIELIDWETRASRARAGMLGSGLGGGLGGLALAGAGVATGFFSRNGGAPGITMTGLGLTSMFGGLLGMTVANRARLDARAELAHSRSGPESRLWIRARGRRQTAVYRWGAAMSVAGGLIVGGVPAVFIPTCGGDQCFMRPLGFGMLGLGALMSVPTSIGLGAAVARRNRGR